MSSGLNSRISLDGQDRLVRALARAGEAALDGLQVAMVDEMEKVMEEAKLQTPVLTGTLRASGVVLPAERMGDQITVTAGFGGAAADYAVIVHEDLGANHPVGNAKFLENPMSARRDEIAKNLAVRLEAKLAGLGL